MDFTKIKDTDLSIYFNKNEIFDLKKFTLNIKNIIIINDIIFSILILVWYLLYKAGIFTFANPYIGLLLSLFNNIVTFYYLIRDHTSIKNLLLYAIIFIFIKILPLISMYDDMRINHIDIAFMIIVFIIYILILLFINDILMKKNLHLIDIIKNEVIYKYYRN